MNIAAAKYILALRDAAGATHQAEDRPIYEMLLAEAGIILALIETNADRATIASAVASHERLWGHTWLRDPVFNGPSSAWQNMKDVLPK